jgi:hypothetical protein
VNYDFEKTQRPNRPDKKKENNERVEKLLLLPLLLPGRN